MTPAREPLLRTYRPSDRDALLSLWSRCGLLAPWNDPRHDIQRKGRSPEIVTECADCSEV